MKKQQVLLAAGGFTLLLLLWFFGKTVANRESKPIAAAHEPHVFNIENHLSASKQKLNPSQSQYVSKLEQSVSRGDVATQQENAFNQLASFWGDSLHNHELYVFYIYKAAMLVNSEKNLTFAARQILGDLRNEPDMAVRSWKAEQAISLLQKAIVLNPGSDSLKVDLGACYVFGKGMAGDTEETMKGVRQLLEVVNRDSANMQAQLYLGIGGVISSQFAKAVERLEKVVAAQPGNAEAVSWLADAYAGKGDKENATKWYGISKRIVNNAEYSREIDKRIKELK